MAARLDGMDTTGAPQNERVPPVRRRTQVAQLVALLPLRTIGGLRWLTWLATLGNLVGWLGLPVTPVPWPVVVIGWLLFILPAGRMVLAALGVRLILRGLTPGRYPRGGRAHLRLWLAERLAEELGATSTAGAWSLSWYARLLGADIGRDVDLHTVPPITGFLTVGDGAAVELEADLAVLTNGGVCVGAAVMAARVGRAHAGPDADLRRYGDRPGSGVWVCAAVRAACTPGLAGPRSGPSPDPILVDRRVAVSTVIARVPIAGSPQAWASSGPSPRGQATSSASWVTCSSGCPWRRWSGSGSPPPSSSR